MNKIFNESFLHFFLGFVGMLLVSLGATFAISYYDHTSQQTAAASNPVEQTQQ